MNNDWLASALSGSGYSMSSWNAAVSGSPLGSGIQPTWRPNKDTSSGSTLAYGIGISPPNSIVYPVGAPFPASLPPAPMRAFIAKTRERTLIKTRWFFRLEASGRIWWVISCNVPVMAPMALTPWP